MDSCYKKRPRFNVQGLIGNPAMKRMKECEDKEEAESI